MFETIRIIRYILRVSRHLSFSRLQVIAAIVAGLLSGVGYTLMIVVINAALARGPEERLLFSFLALCVVVPACRLSSQALLNSISARAIREMRLQLCRSILATDLGRLEAIGSHRLTASLTEDVTALSTALIQLPALCMHIAIIVASLGYMAWLSPILLLIVLLFIAIGLLSYSLPLRRARVHFGKMREDLDTLYSHFRGVIHGTKELKLHRRRRAAFLQSALTPTVESIQRSTFLGNTIFTAAAVWGNLLFFLTIGLLVFGLARRMGGDPKVLAGYTLSLLYIVTPLEVLFQSLPILSRAATATAKLERLGLELTARPAEPEVPLEEPAPSWQRLELAGVKYTYRDVANGGDAESFSLGPVDLAFRPGEVVFIIGGNGSGKSTLAKILTGLYVPEQGEIRLDGEPINDQNRDRYRQMFSAVFSDFFLFNELLGLEDAAAAEAGAYLEQLHLSAKVKISDGKLSTIDLSQGQRKRLALLVAYLENRPIYFFDEWAADQDPHYKATFYLEILPALKARGKTVFAISHDDHYYGLGDRLIKLDYGQVEWDRRPGEEAVQSAAPQIAAGAQAPYVPARRASTS